MGRRPLTKLEKDKYLMKALQIFWEKGYEGTSATDLKKEAGINPGSLYNAFGSKEGLYLETMKFFIDMSDEGFAMALKSKEDASLPEIVLHFAMNRKMQIMDDGKQSCYIANCSLELGNFNPTVQQLSNKFFTMLKDAFMQAIINGQQKGEISEDKDPEAIAWYLVNTISGIGILRKSGNSIEQIDQVIMSTLSIFDQFDKQIYNEKLIQVDKMYPKIMEMMYGPYQ